ncbi:phosphate/phosphite/phosphonate ABC transporter substrate-binding protein [Rhizosaccharibacter radicis]|uniref:PhnD/SsuA/transferrin family substrate-binding protein n=1 Tax=Rhizosaccharibacter radicis TaxID=2782605 RepID=A0ABT1W082_9PROT|nr:PhnD/SsuA/transferrin family substrate-binding protein [Acetobacteraceae bacterium KSS12]
MIASLPMYDLPERRADTDALWVAIGERLRQQGIAAPRTLSRADDPEAAWRDGRLLLSQSCGLPLLHLPDTVRVVATPRYRAPGCESIRYRSALMVRADDSASDLGALRNRRCGINGRDSNSGMNLLRAAVAPLAEGGRFFASVSVSGSHADSLRWLGEGVIDVAAIDCVTLALLSRDRPALLAPSRVLGWTEATPGLPLITGRVEWVAPLRDALAAVAADPALAAVREALLIEGFEPTERGAYDEVAALERRARTLGYPVLA